MLFSFFWPCIQFSLIKKDANQGRQPPFPQTESKPIGSMGLICYVYIIYIYPNKSTMLGCPWKLVTSQLVSWFITYLRDLQPTYIGVITQLLSTMDIPVNINHLYYYYNIFRYALHFFMMDPGHLRYFLASVFSKGSFHETHPKNSCTIMMRSSSK